MSERRVYTSPVRAEQMQLTRQRIAEAAAELFARGGYAATSVSAVARHAGVSIQTVYNAFGTKPQLLKGSYDITLVGDADPVPLAQRPEVAALYAEPDPGQFLRGYAALGARLLERVGPLMLQIAAGAAAGEADLIAHQEKTDAERLAGTAMVVQRLQELDALAPGLPEDQARDRLWTLNSVQVWDLLTGTLGWSRQAYEGWIGQAMCDATLRRD